MTISHTLNNFFFTIHSDNLTFNDNMHAEYYIDRDNDPNTGFSINGIGAEYRIANNQVSEFREWGDWGNIYNHNPQGDIVDEIYREHDIITNPHRAQLLQTGRHISVVGRVLDQEGNEITITDPTPYEVTGDNEEVTFSLEDPDYYIFRIHSDLIRMEHYAPNPSARGLVHNLHFAIDGLLAGKPDKICCFSDSQLNYKSIEDVAHKEHHIEKELMELAQASTQGCH